MKLKNLWIVFLLLAIFFSFQALAQEPMKKGKGSPKDAVILDYEPVYVSDLSMKIDSNIEEWASVKGIEFGSLLAGEYEYDWTGPKDLSVTLKSRYSTDKLYLLVQVKDNAVVSRKKQWKSDFVEIWLLAPENPIKQNKGLYGISFDLGPLTYDEAPTMKYLSAGKKGTPDVMSATIKLYDGYDIEMAIPFSEFSTLSPAMDGKINFCVLVRDWDQDDPNEDEVVVASCKANPKQSKKLSAKDMGKMTFNLAKIQWDRFLETNPDFAKNPENHMHTKANVVGDKQKETIVMKNHIMIGAGYGFKEGQLSWSQFAFSMPPDAVITRLEAKNLNADEYDEILVYTIEPCEDRRYEGERVYIVQFQDTFIPRAAIQTSQRLKSDPSQSVTNSINYTKTGIELRLNSSPTTSAPFEACRFMSDHRAIPMLFPEFGEKSKTIPLSDLGFEYKK